MDSATKPIKQAFREYLERTRPVLVTGEMWREMLAALAPVSESYLRDLLRDAGVAVEQPWAGVRQQTLADLEQSLCELTRVYETATAAGDRKLARYCRRQVIAGKDRARFSMERPGTPADQQALKTEMVQWMLVWLENPPVFPAWVDVRKERP